MLGFGVRCFILEVGSKFRSRIDALFHFNI